MKTKTVFITISAVLIGVCVSFLLRFIFAFSLLAIANIIPSLLVQTVLFWLLQVLATVAIAYWIYTRNHSLWPALGYLVGFILSLGVGPMD